MKLIAVFFILAVTASFALANNRNGAGQHNGIASGQNARNTVNMQCDVSSYYHVTQDWINLRDLPENTCLSDVKKQIQMEIDASYIYLAMGAHFSRDTVNRPGFADFFFKSAKEEREHGSKLIEYLSMRGQLVEGVTNLLKTPTLVQESIAGEQTTLLRGESGAKGKLSWNHAIDALKDALSLEIDVTNKIRQLIEHCDKSPNYYHLSDWLTGVYLEEQLHGQRELAGKITTLGKMMSTHGALGEFLFDKQNM